MEERCGAIAPVNAWREVVIKNVLVAGLLAVVAGAALAQGADGEVRKIDRAQAKLTLKHGEIKSIDMPAMTMAYRVKDARMLDGLAVGDKVRFEAAKVDGQYVVTVLKKLP
ncbi:MAG: copper-binding protein [Burkholderiales bacterium]|nr:copper-binding protein [Burkholderiales bacterium]